MSIDVKSRQSQCSKEEWEARVDLAAAYRLVADFGWEDLIFTHLSARVPGTTDQFLINPFGLLFDEITASSLVKVDVDGNKVEDSPYEVNEAGFVIHSAVHMSRHDAQCVMHLHTVDGIGVATMKEGLLPLQQQAIFLADEIAYHDYEGIADDIDERDRLKNDLGDRCLLLLRNHGTLVLGPSVATTFTRAYMLEHSCQIQMRMLAAGRELCIPSDAALERSKGFLQTDGMREIADEKVWPALLRRLDRTDGSFRE